MIKLAESGASSGDHAQAGLDVATFWEARAGQAAKAASTRRLALERRLAEVWEADWLVAYLEYVPVRLGRTEANRMGAEVESLAAAIAESARTAAAGEPPRLGAGLAPVCVDRIVIGHVESVLGRGHVW
jgi:hypothetical protein